MLPYPHTPTPPPALKVRTSTLREWGFRAH